MLWRRKGTSLAKGEIVCNACRVARNPRPTRTVPVDEQLRRMTAARMAPVEITCPCGTTLMAPKHRKFCDACRAGRIGDHWRRKTVTRRGVAADGQRVTITELGDRDRWLCHLCLLGVDPRLTGLHPGRASFDHLIPISLVLVLATGAWLGGVVFGFWLPRFWLSRRKSKRLKAFNGSLADTITLIANAYRVCEEVQ